MPSSRAASTAAFTRGPIVGLDQIRYRGSKSQWSKISGVATDPANVETLSVPGLVIFDYNE